MYGRYASAAALRAALESRLLRQQRATGIPLDRFRKEVAFQRLLARLLAEAPNALALKGATSLIWRLGVHLRGTRDLDANWLDDDQRLDDVLAAVEDLALNDGFEYEVVARHPLQGEAEGGVRFSVTARLAGRVFEQLRVDLNFAPADPRPVEHVVLRRNPLAFAGIEGLVVPALPLAHQLAEKLHALLRSYNGGPSSRTQDVFDPVVIAAHLELPLARDVRDAVVQTFDLRNASVPTTPPAIPPGWRAVLTNYLNDSPIPVADGVDDLVDRYRRFWTPILDGTAGGNAYWDPHVWSWRDELA